MVLNLLESDAEMSNHQALLTVILQQVELLLSHKVLLILLCPIFETPVMFGCWSLLVDKTSTFSLQIMVTFFIQTPTCFFRSRENFPVNFTLFFACNCLKKFFDTLTNEVLWVTVTFQDWLLSINFLIKSLEVRV